jgi:hypothetical protein
MELALLWFVLLIAPMTAIGLVVAGRIARAPAWRALQFTSIFLLVAALGYLFIGAVGGNERMLQILDTLWSLNLLSGGYGAFPMPASYDSFARHLVLFWVWACPLILAVFILLAALEYLDAKSGLELAERLKKLLWK